MLLLKIFLSDSESYNIDRLYSLSIHDHIWHIGDSFIHLIEDIEEEEVSKFNLHISKSKFDDQLCLYDQAYDRKAVTTLDSIKITSDFDYRFGKANNLEKYIVNLELSDLYIKTDQKYTRDTLKLIISSSFLMQNVEDDGIKIEYTTTSIHTFIKYKETGIYLPFKYYRCWGYIPKGKQNIKLIDMRK